MRWAACLVAIADTALNCGKAIVSDMTPAGQAITKATTLASTVDSLKNNVNLKNAKKVTLGTIEGCAKGAVAGYRKCTA